MKIYKDFTWEIPMSSEGVYLSREVEKIWPLLGSACPTELCSHLQLKA